MVHGDPREVLQDVVHGEVQADLGGIGQGGGGGDGVRGLEMLR